MTDPVVLKELQERLRQVFATRLRSVVLYGSQARNQAGPDSDLDVLVVLEGPVRLGADLETIVQALYPLQLRLAMPIHALPVPWEDWEQGRYGIYRNALREGVVL
jgi:predicted nucleotidyltransferase